MIETISVRARLAPITRNAGPLAASASRAARGRADSFLALVTPYLDSARMWAAPRVERTGIAMRDTLAPKVSDLLVATAHRMDKTPVRRSRWPRRVATMAMLAAAATAVAAIAMRRRSYPAGYSTVTPAPDSAGPDATATMPEAGGAQAASDPEVNGQHRQA